MRSPFDCLRRLRNLVLPVALAGLAAARVSGADAQSASPDTATRLPADKRLGPLADLNGYFPFVPPATPEAWAQRAEKVRRQILVANGLWPMPTRTPLQPVIHGRVERADYTVEKVYFQSFPGHFVSANLWRPKGRSGRLPGVLSAHGHGGRFSVTAPDEIRRQIAEGQERFEVGGRYRDQARCVQLARMGCVVLQYDMVGYGDSGQLVHRAALRPHLNTLENWGYASAQAEAHLQNHMGLQTYNSICALDFISGLPDVDPRRIAMLGSSGGGTQTMMLCAVDPRPAVAFPAVMVSTAMQGGCLCENACYLRIGTGNVEFAALMAPRPLGMAGANDWTREFETKGLPELKQHYRMLGAEDRVMGKVFPLFPHSWAYPARAIMYQWLNRHLKLGQTEPILEEDFQPLSLAEMTVWDANHPKPPAGDEVERELLRWQTRDAERQMAGLVPRDATTLAEFRRVVGGAIDILAGRKLPEPGAVEVGTGPVQARGEYELHPLLLRHPAAQEELPAIALVPKRKNPEVAIWISPDGKRGLLDAGGAPRPGVARLLAAGIVVVGVDLIGQGALAPAEGSLARNRIHPATANKLWPGYAGYTYGYNFPLFAQRVHDILTAVAAVRAAPLAAARVHVVGFAGAGPWVAMARAQAGAAIDRAVVDTAGFRFARLDQFDDPNFLPGGAKYLDLAGILALSAPHPLWLAGEGAQPPVVTAAYRAAGQPGRLAPFTGEPSQTESAALDWLVQRP